MAHRLDAFLLPRSLFPYPLIITSGVCSLAAQTPPVNFDKDVTPIFQANCTACHGASVKMKELSLISENAALKGGESGPVVVPGKPDENVLYQRVRSGAMPMGKPQRLSRRPLSLIHAAA